MLYSLDGDRPEIAAPDCYVAPTALLIGRVKLMPRASIWFGAVLRGDAELIAIGTGSNVQDNSVLHTDPGFPLTLEEDVTVGHLATLHGCVVGAGSLIGMGATVMNGTRIGRNCLIGARALITEGKDIPDGSIVRGSPGKIVGEVTPDHIDMMAKTAQSYRDRAAHYRLHLEAI
ncbi:gamma carbonic anhydrase family protein [Sphingomonas oleivorans]|uniref:Gamma carbonic anhydrase family protein n=1 Tax=Sphingomonas oleivorans TaxID=1735121 RepID=A0A2T5G1L0_9SPHN|nr:gamma carbonic anhydrase family protein [Sphingomonas oleivorans]PTQ13035.1 gamma carbonic anhydrase family protein [Sphingomonas oleivorans]